LDLVSIRCFNLQPIFTPIANCFTQKDYFTWPGGRQPNFNSLQYLINFEANFNSMKIVNELKNEELIASLQNGEVAVLPTDTLYMIGGSALNSNLVESIYDLRQRDLHKPLIVLISNLRQLDALGVLIGSLQMEILDKLWPNKISVILPCSSDNFSYLHRGTFNIAVRLPSFPELRNLIEQTGPLVAPSCNPQGREPAQTILEAQSYFGNKVSFYVDGGTLKSAPSTLLKLNESGELEILREGAITKSEIDRLLKLKNN
jgi:L-threonylcarbamoyladenylate synthase